MPSGVMLPRIAISPLGMTTLFSCYSHSPAIITSNTTILERFLFNKRNLYIYTIRSTKEGDGGIYECYGTTENGDAFLAQSQLYVGSIKI